MAETTKTVRIPNMSCGHCVMTIQKEIGALAGVTGVTASQETKEATITWTDATSWATIAETLEEIGYPAAE
ncbi:MAG: heavy-metal-associated domain-containing protein [Anaerolineae bacterium]|nr:heavy-metal-associated domain-containing protein [Anaerolineae bacterium]